MLHSEREGHCPRVICDLGEGTFPEMMEKMLRVPSVLFRFNFVLILNGLSVFNKEKEQFRAGVAEGFIAILSTFERKNMLQGCEVTCQRPCGQALLHAIHLITCNWVYSSA